MSVIAGQTGHGIEISQLKGTLLGSMAVLMWGFLPLLRLMAGEVPPLQLTFMSLFTAALAVLTWGKTRRKIYGKPWHDHGQRDVFLAAGFLLGAVVFYFAALMQAPAAEVALITYLWPLGLAAAICISAGRRPGLNMWTGLLLSFSGAALALLSGNEGQGGSTMDPGRAAGYALGLASGACWLGYSLMLGRLPTNAGLHAGIFAWAGIAAALLHLLLEHTVLDLSFAVLLTTACIGIGPYGLAFMAWGQGLRYGHAGLLSALCYTVPVVATTLLILAGMEAWRMELALAALAVTCGAWLAGRDRNKTLAEA